MSILSTIKVAILNYLERELLYLGGFTAKITNKHVRGEKIKTSKCTVESGSSALNRLWNFVQKVQLLYYDANV